MKKPALKALRKLIRPVPLGLIIAVIASGLLFYKILSLVPFTTAENPHFIGSATLSEIKNNILFAPIKAAQIFILKFTDNDSLIRVASAAAAIVAAVCLYLLLRKWFTPRISLLTSIMFIASSWFLHNGRFAAVDVLYLCVWPVLLLVCMWFLSKHHDNKLPFAAILLALVLYIPGTWLFLVSGLYMFRKYTWRTLGKLSPKIKLASIIPFLVVIAPLLYSFTVAQRQIIVWLGFNSKQSLNPVDIAGNFIDIPKQLFWSGLDDPLKWLPGTPILDIFSIAMLILGAYAFRTGYYPAREKLLFGAIILTVVMIGIGNVATVGLLIPLLYVVMANGIAYMLQSWFTVFPRNPLARTSGIVLLCLVVAISCFYQMQRYYVAWPDAPTTESAINAPR